MGSVKRKPQSLSIAVIVWSNIVRQQYLLGLNDHQLCEILGISPRTLYNYRQDPSALTMKQVQVVLDKMKVNMEELLLA